MNKSQIFDLMIAIREEYSSFDVSDDEVERHFKYLKDFSFAAAMANVEEHIRTSKFPPKISDIRGRLGDQLDSERGKAEAADFKEKLERWAAETTAPPAGYWETMRDKLRGESVG